MHSAYFVGDYEDHRFRPKRSGIVDHGGRFYAPQSMTDERGRRVMFGWLREGREEETVLDSGWAGVMSLPRLLTLGDDGLLRSEPVPELATLRRNHRRFADLMLLPEGTTLDGVRGDALEIAAEVDPGDAREVGIVVRLSPPDGAEQTGVIFDRTEELLRVDRSRSTLSLADERAGASGPLSLTTEGTLKLRIFVDRSVIEVFGDGRMCLSELVYPTRPDSLGVGLFARGSSGRPPSARLLSMDWRERYGGCHQLQTRSAGG